MLNTNFYQMVDRDLCVAYSMEYGEVCESVVDAFC